MRALRSLVTLLLFVGVLTAWANERATAATCGTWTNVPAANGNIRLFGVSATSVNDVWAVGHKASQGLKVTLEHWNGSAWAATTPPATATSAGLNDVDAIASNDVWGVGYRGVKSPGDVPSATLAEHWDGSAWKIVPTVDPAGTRSNSLVGVAHSGSDNVWAVGYSTIGFQHRTLTERWDGSAWTAVASANPSSSDALLDVAVVGPNDAWAVGYQNDGSGYRTLIERWDGGSWQPVTSQDPSPTDNVLTAVDAVSASDIWSVGYRTEGSADRTLIEHWDGSSWTTVPSPNLGSEADLLLGTSFDASSDGWAVGAGYVGNRYDSIIEHWDGSSWSIVAAPSGAGAKDRAWGVTAIPGAPGSAWEVGSTDKTGTTAFFCPGTGSTVVAPATSSVVPLSAPRPADPPSLARSEPDAAFASPVPLGSARQVTATDEATSAGIAQMYLSYGAAVADYDGNGWADFVYGRHFDPAELYANDANPPANTFTQSFSFPTVDRHACSWGDVNGDGLLDLFCGTGGDSGTDIHANELWIQQPDHTLVDEAGAYGVLDPTSRGRRGVFVDANDDGWPDLWLGNVSERPDGLPSPNRLLLNHGGAGFVDAPSFGIDLETNGGCGQAFDYNTDGFQDLLTCSGVGLSVYRNDGGVRFTNVTATLGLPTKPTDARMVDLNGDGRVDFVGLQPGILTVYLQQADGSFTRTYRKMGLGNAVTVSTGDVNGDARPDLFIVTGLVNGQNAPDLLLVNDGTGRGFTQLPTPQTTAGAGDTASALDYDHNGLTDFLVTNGGCNSCRGPLQLIAFFPTG